MWSNADQTQIGVAVVISINQALNIDGLAQGKTDKGMTIGHSREEHVWREDGQLNEVPYRKRVSTMNADVMQGSHTFQKGH